MRMKRNPFTGGKDQSVNKQWQKYLNRKWYFATLDRSVRDVIESEKEANLTQDSFINGWRAAFAWMDEMDAEREAKRKGVQS